MKQITSTFLVMVFIFFALGTLGAENPVPTHPVDGEYIKEWLVLGPFFPDDLEKDFLAGVGGEANVAPKPRGRFWSHHR
jgi:hypothetical protein